MTHINGTLTVSDPTVPFTRWKVTANRVMDGAVVGASYVTTSGSTPADYSINCGDETGACLVTVAPAIAMAWESGAAGLNQIVVPTDSGTPYVYQATSAPVTPDPLDANVVFYAHLDDGFTDSKGMTVTVDSLTEIVGDKPAATVDGSGSAVFTGATGSGTSGLSVQDAGLVIGTSDFCLEFWFKHVPVPGDDVNTQREIIRLHDADIPDSENLNAIIVGIYPIGAMRLAIISGGMTVLESWSDFYRGGWQHIAIVWANDFVSTFINGQYQANDGPTDMTFQAWDFPMDRLSIGVGGWPMRERFNGNICRVRLTVGDARYTEPFTPPAIFSGTPAQTGVTEPEWPTTVAATVTDGDVTWTNIGRMVQPITHGWLLPG